jgi:hypothetical protein
MGCFQSFITGITSLFDFRPLSERHRDLLERSDTDALRSDWEMVGKDLSRAMGLIEKEIKDR